MTTSDPHPDLLDAIANLQAAARLLALDDLTVAPVTLDQDGHDVAQVTEVYRWDPPDDSWGYTVAVPTADGPVTLQVTVDVRHTDPDEAPEPEDVQATLAPAGTTTVAQVDALPAAQRELIAGIFEASHRLPDRYPALERVRQTALARERIGEAVTHLADTGPWLQVLAGGRAGTAATLAADWDGDLTTLADTVTQLDPGKGRSDA